VLVHAGEKKHVVTHEPAEARDDIGEHFFAGVTEMRGAIEIIDGGGDVEIRHEVCGCK